MDLSISIPVCRPVCAFRIFSQKSFHHRSSDQSLAFIQNIRSNTSYQTGYFNHLKLHVFMLLPPIGKNNTNINACPSFFYRWSGIRNSVHQAFGHLWKSETYAERVEGDKRGRCVVDWNRGEATVAGWFWHQPMGNQLVRE